VRELERIIREEDGERPSETPQQHQAVVLCINLPATFLFVAPFAAMPFVVAQLLWLTLLAGSLVLGGFLICNLSEIFSPIVSVLLVCIVLANSEGIFLGGNTAGIAVSMCVVAVWCFVRERFGPAGIICIALSFAIKPHDAGFVWLYFLLAGGVYRRRALQAFAVTAVLALSAVLWVSHVAPNWMQDRENNFVITAHGGINDPGPSSSVGFHNLDPVIDMQSVISVFRNEPRIYDSITYLICGSLVLIWIIATLKFRISMVRTWLALAAIVPLTLLITYHRPWDAKLLLLTVPACAMLWAKGGLVGWLAVSVTAVALLFTGDIPMAIVGSISENLRTSSSSLSGQILTIVTGRQIPLILLAMGIFYLWVYIRHSSGLEEPSDAQGSSNSEPLAPGKLESDNPTLTSRADENSF